MSRTRNNANNQHVGHRQRMRRRFTEHGLDSLADHEALELLLYQSIPLRDTNELAHDLLRHYGSFSAVLDASPQELLKIPGIGENTAFFLTSLPDFFRRYQLDLHGPRPRLENRFLAANYVSSLFIGNTYESFYMICMNTQCEVLRAVRLGDGTLEQVYIYPRLAVELALRFHARFVLLAHNHPSGNPHPSAEDVSITDTIVKSLNGVDIDVVDHLIYCGDTAVSMAELGFLPLGY